MPIVFYFVIGLGTTIAAIVLNTDPDGRLTPDMRMDPSVALESRAVVVLGNAPRLLLWPITFPIPMVGWT